MEEGMKEGRQDLVLAPEHSFRRETPEVSLVTNANLAVSELGETARRMIESLPKFGRMSR